MESNCCRPKTIGRTLTVRSNTIRDRILLFAWVNSASEKSVGLRIPINLLHAGLSFRPPVRIAAQIGEKRASAVVFPCVARWRARRAGSTNSIQPAARIPALCRAVWRRSDLRRLRKGLLPSPAPIFLHPPSSLPTNSKPDCSLASATSREACGSQPPHILSAVATSASKSIFPRGGQDVARRIAAGEADCASLRPAAP